MLTFILLDDISNLFHTILQLPAHPVGQRINLIQYVTLLFQFPAHVLCLIPKHAHCPKDSIELLVLLMHHLNLLLCFKLAIWVVPISVIVKASRIRQSSIHSDVRGILDRLLQLFPHTFHLASNILHKAPPAGHFVGVEAEAVRVVLNGLHRVN